MYMYVYVIIILLDRIVCAHTDYGLMRILLLKE